MSDRTKTWTLVVAVWLLVPATPVLGELFVLTTSAAPADWDLDTTWPRPRYSHNVVALGGAFYFANGYEFGWPSQSLDVYDATSRVWMERAPSLYPRADAAAAAFEGRLWSMGGQSYDCAGYACDRVEIYDPSTDTWALGPSLPYGVMNAAAAVADGRIWLFGGTAGCEISCHMTSSVFMYDPDWGFWMEGPALPEVTSHAVAVAMGDRIYVTGGHASVSNRTTLFVLDTGTLEWSRGPDMPEHVIYAMGAACGGQLLVVGGVVNGHAPTDAAHLFDPIANEWTAGPSLPEPLALFGLGLTTDGSRVIASAGSGGFPERVYVHTCAPATLPLPPRGSTATWETHPAPPVNIYGASAGLIDGTYYLLGGYGVWTGMPNYDLFAYDLSSGTWRVATPPPEFVSDATTAVVDGKLWVMGGYSTACFGGVCDQVLVYDPDVQTWSVGPSLPRARAFASATTGPDGIVLVAGGYTYDWPPSREIDMYDPLTDQWTAAAMEMPLLVHETNLIADSAALHVIGGHTEWGDPGAYHQRFGFTTGEWTFPQPPRHQHAGGVIGECAGDIYVAAGAAGFGSTVHTERFDPTTERWSHASDVPTTYNFIARGQVSADGVTVITGAAPNRQEAAPTSVLRCAGGSVGVGLPDLAVTGIMGPEAPSRGQDLRVQARVVNSGRTPSPPTEVEFFPGGRVQILPLLPGQSVVVNSPAIRLTFDSHLTVSAAVDPNGLVPEPNENNNYASRTFASSGELTRCDRPGPDRFGYTCRVESGVDIIDLTLDPTAGRIDSFDDCNVAQVSLPFEFEYYGVARQTAYVSPDGRVAFDALAICGLVAATEPQDLLVLNSAWATDVLTQTLTVDGTPAFLVQWEGGFGTGFELMLLADGEIRFVYGDTSCLNVPSIVRAHRGAGGLRFAYLGACPSQTAVTFEPGPRALPVPSAPQMADLVITSFFTQGTTTAGRPVTFVAQVENQGDASSQATGLRFDLDGKESLGTAAVPALAPGESVFVSSGAWTATPGAHVATGRLDPENVVLEAREDNNVDFAAVVIAEETRPDLVATRLDTIPQTPKAGDNVVFQLTLENQGTAMADLSAAFFYLDGTHDPLVDAWNTPPLPPGGEAVIEFGPHVVTQGVHHLESYIDSVSGETDVDNNFIERFITVGDGTAANLRAANATATPAEADPGQNVTFEVDVENAGTLPAPAFTVAFRLDDGTLVGERRVEGLAPGAVARVASPAWPAAGAPRAFTATADARNNVPETDEGDNQATGSVRVRSADFAVVNLTHDPAFITAGDVVTFYADVTNHGDWPAPATKLRFDVDGTPQLSDVDVPALAPGESARVQSLPWVAQRGPHLVTATADSTAAVVEEDERDNERVLPFVVFIRTGLSAELVIVDVTTTPADPTSDDVVTFIASIGNEGGIPSTSFDVAFYVDGAPHGARRVAALAPGQTAQVESDAWDAVGGNTTIRIIADERREVTETNEDDNAREETFSPRAPDLVIADLATSPSPTFVGQSPLALVTVHNRGDHASGTSTLHVTLDGAPLGDVTVPALAPGESAIVESATWTAVRGAHALAAAVDAIGTQDESNETNNDAALAFETQEVDLEVVAITTDPAKPSTYSYARFHAFVRNRGPDPAPASHLRFNVDFEASLGTVAVPALAPGEVAEVVSLSWFVTPGYHRVTATADANLVLPEANETNNALEGDLGGSNSPCATAGPDAGGYRCHSVPYEWVELGTNAPQLSLGDDVVSGALPLPWTFDFYGTDVSNVYVSSNGFITFQAGAYNGCCSGGGIPWTSSPNALVAGYWEDLYPPGGGSITYGTRTVDGASAFIVQFSNVPHYCCSSYRTTFQFQLFEDGRIRVMYDNVQSDGGVHTAGIENFAGTSGLTYKRGSFSLDNVGIGYSRDAVVVPEAPDLAVSGATITPDNVQMGDVVRLDATLRNDGGSTARGFTIGYQNDGSTFAQALVPALATGWPLPLRASFVTPGGQHTARVVADTTQQIAEPNENDNVADAPYYARWPNLVVTDVAWTPDPLYDGNVTTFRATITNVGDGDARVYTHTSFHLDNMTRLLGNVVTPPILAGASATVSVSGWTATGGDHNVRVAADRFLGLSESSESDNVHIESFRVPLADLVVTGVETSPSPAVHGDALRILAVLLNQGDHVAAPSVLRVTLDGATLQDLAVPSLAPGQSTTVEASPVSTVGGDHVVVARSDATSVVKESSETNNDRSLAFRVRQADLTVPRLSWTPADPQAGDLVTLTADVANVGDAAAAPSVVRFVLDGATLADVALASVDANGTAAAQVTWTASGGDFDIAVLADATALVAERNETNNARASGFRVRIAELMAGALAATPSDPEHADAVTLTLPVVNQGDAAAGAFRVRLLVDGTAVAEAESQGLAAGEATNFSLPWTASGGPHEVQAVVDAEDAVLESDESDNVATLALHVRQAELDVGALTSDPASPAHGDAVALQVEVTNSGDAATGAFVVRFLVGGEIVGDAAVAGLAAGETTLAAVAWTAIGGDHAVTAVVDALDDVAERDESDGTATGALHVRQADLVAAALAASPASPAHGDAVSFSLTVRNDGDADAPAATVTFTVDGATLGVATLPALAPGEAATATSVAWVAVQGEHAATAAVDPEDAVAETDETNGASSLALHVRVPDLVAESVQTDPASPAHGETVALRGTVRNDGDADAAAFVVRFTVDGAVVGETLVGGVPAGATVAVDGPFWTAVGGERLLGIVVDATETVDEASETDNAAHRNVHVRQADVVADALALTPGAPADGDAVVASFRVRNAGDAASGPFAVRIVVDDATVLLDTTIELAPGEVRTLESAAWNATPGAHLVVATADALGEVEESSETNNARNATFVSRQPDLVVESLEAQQDLPPNNKDVTITARVANAGNAGAATFRVKFVLEDGTALGTVLVEGLAAGEARDVSLPPVRLKFGVHTVIATADDLDQVAELDESNNERSHTFTVTTPGTSPV